MFGISARAIFYDIVKFVIVLFGLRILMAFLSFVYGWIMLQSLKISASASDFPQRIEIPEADPEKVYLDIQSVMFLSQLLCLPLALLYVFFSVPSKRPGHFLACGIIIWASISAIMRADIGFQMLFQNGLIVFASMGTAWLCSIALARIPQSRIKSS